jgi:hypothetical protein
MLQASYALPNKGAASPSPSPTTTTTTTALRAICGKLYFNLSNVY